MAAGRRLATEPGGVVGAGPVPRSGATREFTPGGSGLVRNRSMPEGGSSAGRSVQGFAHPGPVPAGGATTRRGRGGQRPDYLVEDEGTWTQVNRRVVPPVID